MPRTISLRKRLIFTAIVVAAFLPVTEVIMRFAKGPLPPVYRPGMPRQDPNEPPREAGNPLHVDPLRYFAVADEYLGYRNCANGAFHAWYIEGSPLVTTDHYGYRNTLHWAEDAETPIVLFVGDSFTFCAEVPDDRTGPSEVARLLGPSVRVLNAAVRGYNSLQAKRSAVVAFERFKDIRVVVYVYCSNDPVGNLVYGWNWPLRAPLLTRDESGHFVELPMEPALPWGERLFTWVPPSPSQPSWLAEHSIFWRSIVGSVRSLTYQLKDGPGPPDSPDPPTTPEAGVSLYEWAERNGGPESVYQLVGEMDDLCRQHNAVLVVTAYYYRTFKCEPVQMAESCRKQGIAWIPEAPEFEESPELYFAKQTDGRLDAHYGPEGTRVFAKTVTPAIQEALRESGNLEHREM